MNRAGDRRAAGPPVAGRPRRIPRSPVPPCPGKSLDRPLCAADSGRCAGPRPVRVRRAGAHQKTRRSEPSGRIRSVEHRPRFRVPPPAPLSRAGASAHRFPTRWTPQPAGRRPARRARRRTACALPITGWFQGTPARRTRTGCTLRCRRGRGPSAGRSPTVGVHQRQAYANRLHIG